MRQDISRRSFIGQAGLAAGSVALVSLGGCGSSDSSTATGPKATDFPYEKFIPAGYTISPSARSAIAEAGYHGFWEDGCCHGVYSGIMSHFAKTVGAPFDQIPLNIGGFGGGGIGYGSICGALLGGVLAINNVVADPAARGAIMTDLLRWYEGNAFPAYVPAAINSAEVGTTLDFSAANISALQSVPNSHLCHASRTQWSVKNGVAAAGMDLYARCGRLTADVAAKVVDQINAYLATKSYTASAIDAVSATCLGCHPATSTTEPVASGMRCDSCHADKVTGHP